MRKLIILVGLLLLLSSTSVVAQTKPWEERKEQWQERIKERIELVISRFDNNKERHIAVYNAAKDRLKQIADELEARGYDVSKVRADFQTLDSMIVKFAQDYASFIDQLRAAEQYEPGTQGFKGVIEAARSKLKTVRDDALDIRHYWQTVVRPDLKSLRDQNPTPKSSAPTSSPSGT